MIHKWWHRFVRKRTQPIPEDTAVLWKRRLSIVYGLLAWNAFGFVVYSGFKGKTDWAHYYGLKTDEEYATPPGYLLPCDISLWSLWNISDVNKFAGQSWANTLGIKNAKVYRISGFKKVDEYEIVDGQIEKDQDKGNIDSNKS